ncbi:hypothetical protein EMCG_03472 [[Emmonsia] crescens]|uniref:Uncharacterized protein n=1 Tax=[Emmonsia] crescens TaxID=73230 RepID=A0A0G2J8C9_9EURO|nr:hypothetical protein EMCG_03472 [Emmonsia crescens UAMH 3008]
MNPSSPKPLSQQHTNHNLNQLLIDTFDKVGKASGAGGLETSKWAVKDGDSLSRYRHRSNPRPHQQQPLSQQKQFGNRGSQRTSTNHTAMQDSQQPPRLSSPHQHENRCGESREREMEVNRGTGDAAAPSSFKTTTSTRDGDATRVLRVTDVGMDVDMGSLHALVGQCIDPGLERIVDVWEVGDPYQMCVDVPHGNTTLQLDKQSDAILLIA